jgi:putative metalloenzyme radical SAM/SPASM domain maturase
MGRIRKYSLSQHSLLIVHIYFFLLIDESMSVPKKLYIESTTRCNLACDKCIKQMPGNRISNEDLPLPLFEKLLPELGEVDTLILNGIGEPLLHPHLVEMVAKARAVMKRDGVIGFQSNGVLMSTTMAEKLVEAGLSSVCFSLDGLQGEGEGNSVSSPSSLSVARALGNLRPFIRQKEVQTGLEIVVSQDNVEALPDLIQWGADQGVNYILVSHLFAYDKEMTNKSLFSPITQEVLSLFVKYQELARQQGIDLVRGLQAHVKFNRAAPDKQALELLAQMRKQAQAKDIYLHWADLLEYDAEQMDHTSALFATAQQVALARGIALELPPLQAEHNRSCLFIEDQAAFIGTRGEVMPCHFLWHSYSCMGGNEVIDVQQRDFGNLHDRSLTAIWEGDEYKRFREEARRAEYSRCWSCPQSPCADIVNNNLLTANDCHGSIVPCGHCRWSIGGLRCL